MSGSISRRTFLKASGLAVLSAAAASALAGCGGGGAPGAELPTLQDGTKQDFVNGTTSVTVNLGSFVKAGSIDGKYYIYTYLQIDNTYNTVPFAVNISDFTCTVQGTAAAVSSLGTFNAETSPTEAVEVGMETPEKMPFYVQVSAEQYQNFDRMQVTFAQNGVSVTFDYDATSPYPQSQA